MSFDNGGNDMAIGSGRDCKADYEAQAVNLKEKIDDVINLQDSLENFIERGDAYRFQNISSLAELLGGLIIIRRKITKSYNRLLKQIENGN